MFDIPLHSVPNKRHQKVPFTLSNLVHVIRPIFVYIMLSETVAFDKIMLKYTDIVDSNLTDINRFASSTLNNVVAIGTPDTGIVVGHIDRQGETVIITQIKKKEHEHGVRLAA